MSHKNEEVIKQKIMEARKRGVCDKNGETLQSFLRAKHGIEEKCLHLPSKQYDMNYEIAFGHK